MTIEERMDLANQLRKVLREALAPSLCTGTGQELRERKHELARLMARVSAVVMYDDMPDSERAFRTRHLENEAMKAAEEVGLHTWPVK